MIFLPLLAVVLSVAFLSTRGSGAASSPAISGAHPVPRPVSRPASRQHAFAIARYAQSRMAPPTQLVWLALEEARLWNDRAMLEALVQRYVAPAVEAAEAAARGGYPPPPAYAQPPTSYASPPGYAPDAPPPPAYAPAPIMPPEYAPAPIMPPEYAPTYAPPPPVAPGPITSPSQVAQAPGVVPAPAGATDEDYLRMLAQMSGAAMAAPPPAAAPANLSPPSTSTAGTITVSGRSSPIDGVSNEAWAMFTRRVAREHPTFEARDHVGQFRQRRERLVQLGFDPARVVGQPDAQVAALDADMQDAYRRAVATGLHQFVGTRVDVPTSAGPRQVPVTLSGVLSVVQAAGVIGAQGWFNSPAERYQFPNTTVAFLRSNQVF